MIRKIRPVGLLLTVLALAVAPAVSQANHGKGKGKGKTKHCLIHRGFVLKGTLAAGSTFGANPVIRVIVTGGNKHARASGEEGPFSDDFRLKMNEESAHVGDKVRVIGKIEYTKKKCPDSGYGDVDVRVIKITHVGNHHNDND